MAGVVAWRLASESVGDGGASASGGRFRVTLPKQTPVEVGLEAIRLVSRSNPDAPAGGPSRVELSVRIGVREQGLTIEAVGAGSGPSLSGGVLFDVAATGRTVRISLVRKKSGELEIGLRDRVIRGKAEPA